jgi:hypothetical protein
MFLLLTRDFPYVAYSEAELFKIFKCNFIFIVCYFTGFEIQFIKILYFNFLKYSGILLQFWCEVILHFVCCVFMGLLLLLLFIIYYNLVCTLWQ